jgi:ParB family transcriptional regulator, chromosome partitioning protein
MPKKLNFKEIGLHAVSPRRPSATAHPISHLAANAGFLYVPLELLRPDPDQPRKYFDDATLDDLTASIREKGVLQPILIRKEPAGEGFVIIAGERRWRAAKAVGLKELPALMRDAQDALEVALIENVQRENLKPLEEAEALMRLKQARGFTDQALAKIIGKSRTSVTELLTLNQLPESIKKQCRTSDIWTRSQLLQLVRAGSSKEIEEVWARIKDGSGATVRDLRRSSRPAGRKRAGGRYRFLHKPKGRTFQVLVTFSKAKATRSEVGAALKDALKHLP